MNVPQQVTPTFHYGLASQLYSYVMSQTSENSELSERWERQTEFFSHHGDFMWNYNQSEFPRNCDKFSQTIKYNKYIAVWYYPSCESYVPQLFLK